MQNLKIKTTFIMLIVTGSSWSLDSDREEKVIIEGPGCVTKLKSNQTECLKGLSIKQGSLLIKSTYGLINHKNKGIENVLMKGDQVYLEQLLEDQDKMIIMANQIDYKKAAEKVYLVGNVSITSSIGVTTGENIEFDLKTQEITTAGDDSKQQFRMEIDQKDD